MGTTTTVVGASLSEFTPADPSPTPALGLSRHDIAGVLGLVRAGDPEMRELVADTRALAQALAGPDGDGARTRMLARATATTRSQSRLIETLLAQRIAARDFDAVFALLKAADSATRRLTMLAKQLANESALRHRPSVFIKNAASVSFRTEMP